MSDENRFEGFSLAKKHWQYSLSVLQEGAKLFREIGDKNNEALLNANAARLMRVHAYFQSTSVGRSEIDVVEEGLFNKVSFNMDSDCLSTIK